MKINIKNRNLKEIINFKLQIKNENELLRHVKPYP